ncbi:MAG: efflux transporter periplasmic adaptor subunit, partial [Alphaproteobacteria bacterium]
ATGGNVQAEPFFVRIQLDETGAADLLMPGVVGSVAIYTNSVAATHIIRKVMIRMESILNYLNPAL